MKESGYLMLDLSRLYNGAGSSYNSNPGGGAFGIRSAYPAEELPFGSVFEINGIPFRFPEKKEDNHDNIECYNQFIPVPKSIYQKAYFLGSADNASYLEKFSFSYKEHNLICNAGLSNWIEEAPVYGEMPAISCNHLHTKSGDDFSTKCCVWLQSVQLKKDVLSGINLPENPCFHIFAITLKLN